MGIPRLTAHLEPYFETTVIGCQGNCRNPSSNSDQKIVIDGPGLAYYIYHTLVARSGAVSAIDALPSYQALGELAIDFINGLRSRGVEIECVYFDGYLPEAKRSTRLARLESYRKQLSAYHSRNLTGTRVRKSLPDLTRTSNSFASFLGRSSSRAFSGGLPAASFLVPAVIESLRGSRYSNLIKLVPGEADVFCAHYARLQGCIVLTSDSDLLVYDLGDAGSVTFFDSLQFGECPACHEQAVIAKLCRPKNVCSRLGIKCLLDLGYEIKSDYTISLSEAVGRAKRASSRHDRDFLEFAKEYRSSKEAQSASSLYHVSGKSWDTAAQLDPRLSELVIQALQGTHDAGLHIYMPFLIEDPTRASAWEVAENVRILAYRLNLDRAGEVPDCIMVVEHYRRASSIRPVEICIHISNGNFEDAAKTKELLTGIQHRYSQNSRSVLWRLCGMLLVLQWYTDSGRTLPTNEAILRTLRNSVQNNEWQSWPDIHFAAQLEAALYSLRMLNQTLMFLRPQAPVLADFSETLLGLPALAQLMPGRCALENETINLDILKACLDPDSEEKHIALGTRPERSIEDTKPETISKAKHARKKRKKAQKKVASSTIPQGVDTNNFYSILPPS
ncbi:MAG: hypothetical protein MMC23_000187 [Stictis urceolatum]|nr:hypothetical protein [Stictis urceolata]